ncbi:hypothetical protein C8T65DRAFT_674543 [Cerioporus squamosus]|nr:hypothetical protein C8T65DRAFT_674543 [Cerioporus squamosus]
MMEYAGQPLSQSGLRAGISGPTGSNSSASSGIPVAQHHQLAQQGTNIHNANHGGMVPLYPMPMQQQYSGIPLQHYQALPAGSGGTGTRTQSAVQLYPNGAFAPNNMGNAQSAPHAPQQQNGYMPQQHARPPPSGGQYPQGQYGSSTAHAGPSQTSRSAAPMQHPQPPSCHNRQTSHPGGVHPPQGPRPIASAQSRSAPQANASTGPVPASSTQQPHATGSQQPSSESLPTPPPTAHPDSGGAKLMTIQDASHVAALNALKPLRDSIAESLGVAHKRVAEEYARLHVTLVTSENRLRTVMAKCVSLQQDIARLTVERDAAIKVADQFKKDKEAAVDEMQKMNTNLPKLVVEYYELKSDHALLQQEMAAVKEENAQLREKAQAKPTPVYTYESVFSAPDSPAEQKVKLEKSPLVVKRERQSAPDSPQSDPDAAFAVELAQQHEQRKRKQRDIDELMELLRQSESIDLPVLPSLPSASYLPPTPTSPLTQSFPSCPTSAASSSTTPTDSDPSDASSSLAVKAEQREATLHFGISDLERADVSGELEIIDLTCTDSSPMQLTSDLPPFSRRVQEDVHPDRKRVLAAEENESDQPSKKQRMEAAEEGELADEEMNMDDAQPAANVDVAPSITLSSTHSEMRSAEVPAATPTASSEVKPVPDSEPRSGAHMEIQAKPIAQVASQPPLTVMPASIELPPPPPAPARPTVPLPSAAMPPAMVSSTPRPTPTHSPTVADLSNLSLPSSSSAVQLPPPVVVRASSAKGLGVMHIPLMYDNIRDKLHCKVCVARSKSFSNFPVTILPEDADWPTLRGHYESEHPAACDKLVKMSPEQIRMKKAENDGKKVPFPFKKRKSAP